MQRQRTRGHPAKSGEREMRRSLLLKLDALRLERAKTHRQARRMLKLAESKWHRDHTYLIEELQALIGATKRVQSSESSVRVPRRLAQVLRERFAQIIDSDHLTYGFSEDVAKAFGVKDPYLLTDEQEEQGKEFARRIALRIRDTGSAK